MKTIKHFGTWAVTEAGLDHTANPTYEIDADQLLLTNWVEHMSLKRWVNMKDFNRAFEFALNCHLNRKEAA